MSSPIQLNDPKITQLGLASEIDFCHTMAVAKLDCEGIVAVSARLIDPLVNVVIDIQTTEHEVDQKIKQAIAFFKEHNEKWTWIVGPLSKPVTLIRHLRANNIVFLERFPGMYLDLSTAPSLQSELVTNAFLQKYNIEEAPADDDLQDWITPARECFPSSDNAEGYRTLNAGLPHGENGIFHHYVSRYQNHPVACGTLFTTKVDTVMIHNVGTKYQFRNRGYGTALTIHAMMEAKKRGFKHCFLDSSQQGLSIYQKLGFKIYAFYQMYGFK